MRDLAHTDDPTHGQQELACYNHYSKRYDYRPLFVFEGTSGALVMAGLRPGKRPTGVKKAMILVRLLAHLRPQWPETPLLVRADSHCMSPELLDAITRVPGTDCVFGLAAHAVSLRQAVSVMEAARPQSRRHTALAHAQPATVIRTLCKVVPPHQTVPGADTPPSAPELPGHRAPPSGHSLAVCRPWPRAEHVLKPPGLARVEGLLAIPETFHMLDEDW